MPFAKITQQGLISITVSVGLLWGVWIGETVMRRRAVAERIRVMRDVRRVQLRQIPQPASSPIHRNLRRLCATEG